MLSAERLVELQKLEKRKTDVAIRVATTGFQDMTKAFQMTSSVMGYFSASIANTTTTNTYKIISGATS
jgi:hypothetical protein